MTAGGTISSSSVEGQLFVRLCSIYVGVVAFVDLAYLASSRVHSRRLDDAVATITKMMCRTHGPSEKPVVIACLSIVSVPALIIALSLCLGPVIALSEGWRVDLGMEYMISNTMGLVAPLTNATPDSPASIHLAICVSVLGLLLITTALVVGTFIVESVRPWEYKNTKRNFILWFFVAIPAGFLALSVVLGGVLAAIEGWPMEDGLYFMAGQIIGAANPFTPLAPVTGDGCFVEVLCIGVQVVVQSFILDVVSQHPKTREMVTVLHRVATKSALLGSDSSEQSESAQQAGTSHSNLGKAGAPGDHNPPKEVVDIGEMKRRAAALEAELQALLKAIEENELPGVLVHVPDRDSPKENLD